MGKKNDLKYVAPILIDGSKYDNYEIISIEWNLTNNIFAVKVAYSNIAESKKTTRNYPLDVHGDVLINDAIKTIHQMHKKYLL